MIFALKQLQIKAQKILRVLKMLPYKSQKEKTRFSHPDEPTFAEIQGGKLVNKSTRMAHQTIKIPQVSNSYFLKQNLYLTLKQYLLISSFFASTVRLNLCLQ